MYSRNIADTVDMTVTALCADFRRRSDALLAHSVTHRTRMEYKYLNFKLLSAADEIVGEGLGERMIEEIGYSIGYAYTELDHMSESTYKKMKRQVKENIAKKLHLID